MPEHYSLFEVRICCNGDDQYYDIDQHIESKSLLEARICCNGDEQDYDIDQQIESKHSNAVERCIYYNYIFHSIDKTWNWFFFFFFFGSLKYTSAWN